MAKINRKRKLVDPPPSYFQGQVNRERVFFFKNGFGLTEITYHRIKEPNGTFRFSVQWMRFRGNELTMLANGMGWTRQEAFDDIRKDIAGILALRLKGLNQEFD